MSEMNKQLKPKIRFEQFYGDWKQQTLGEVSESIQYGLGAAAKEYDGINKYLRITDIDEVTNVFKKDNLSSPDIDLEFAERYLLQDGDVLFARTGASTGKSYRYRSIDGKVYFAGFLIRARIKMNTDAEFVFQNTLRDHYNNFVKITSQRSGQPGINATEYAGYTFRVPSTNEQTAIGNFFQQLDKLIELQTRAVESAETYKKAMLQKMFPQKGEKVPRVRFEGFSGDWEQRTIASLSETTIGGGTPSTAIERYWQGEIPWIQSSDLLIDNVLGITPTKTITEDAINNSAARLIPKNSLAIVTRVGVGKLCFIPYEYATSQDFLSLVNLNIDHLYVTYNLYRFLQEEKNKVQGTAIKGLTKADLLNQSISVAPFFEEQEKIGNFFQKLDQNIESEKKKLEQYQTMKRALLQRMFV